MPRNRSRDGEWTAAEMERLGRLMFVRPLLYESSGVTGSTRPRAGIHVAAASHIGVRRRLRHLPLLGELLARADRRARRLPSVPGGGGGFSADPARCISAGHPADRARRARLFGRSGNIPRPAPCAGTRGMVVVLCAPARFRGAQRMGVHVLCPPPRPAQRPHEIALGPCAAGGTLPAAELDLPAAVRRDLCGGVRVSRGAGAWG